MTRAEFFQRQLGALRKDLPAGTRLPPVRTLLKEYHISLTTFNKAVKHFKDAGRLRAIHGSGIYVDKLPEKIGGEPVEVVNILFFGYRSSLTSEGFIRSLSNLLGLQLSLAGMSATFTLFPPEASLEAVKQKLKKMRPQAVITINMYNPGITQYLRSRGIPYICITPAHPADQEYSLYLDDASIMKQILDYLTKLGHRHICYIHGVSTQWYLRWEHIREREFYRCCTMHNIVPNLNLVRFGNFSPEGSAAAIREILNQGCKFTAVIADDHIVSGVYRELARAGLRIPEDVSVIGINDLELACHLLPPLTTVRNSTEELARLAVAGLVRRIAGETDFTIPPLPVELIVRDSATKCSSIQSG